MPSSKTVDKSADFVRDTVTTTLTPKVVQDKGVVSLHEWCNQNHDHLSYIYSILQEACNSSGRYVFDSQTCNFQTFCKIAYQNSYKYKKYDTNYDSDSFDEDQVIF